MTTEPTTYTPDEFDRTLGMLEGLPDVIKTGQSTIRVVPLLGVGGVKTFIVQSVRHREQGDTIFLEYMDGRASLRLVIPPKVAQAIARQRDALTDRSRSKAAKTLAAERKARGEMPGFMRTKRGKK